MLSSLAEQADWNATLTRTTSTPPTTTISEAIKLELGTEFALTRSALESALRRSLAACLSIPMAHMGNVTALEIWMPPSDTTTFLPGYRMRVPRGLSHAASHRTSQHLRWNRYDVSFDVRLPRPADPGLVHEKVHLLAERGSEEFLILQDELRASGIFVIFVVEKSLGQSGTHAGPQKGDKPYEPALVLAIAITIICVVSCLSASAFLVMHRRGALKPVSQFTNSGAVNEAPDCSKIGTAGPDGSVCESSFRA